eukprot:gene8992-biopygen6398
MRHTKRNGGNIGTDSITQCTAAALASPETSNNTAVQRAIPPAPSPVRLWPWVVGSCGLGLVRLHYCDYCDCCDCKRSADPGPRSAISSPAAFSSGDPNSAISFFLIEVESW